MHEIAINDIVKQAAKFTNCINYAIYHKKHTFADCPILKDIDYLRKYFIYYCILMNYTQKQIVVTINHIDASWDTDDDTTDEPDCALDYSHANTDNDSNFQEEEV